MAQNKPARVLLVEDDPAIAMVIEAALEDEGFELTRVSSVAQRDAALAKAPFNAMLTDVILEDGDGLATLDTVRREAPVMPIIVRSAQNTLDTAVRASDSDAFEYFPKPFDLDELVPAVRQAVGASQHAEDPAPEMEVRRVANATQGDVIGDTEIWFLGEVPKGQNNDSFDLHVFNIGTADLPEITALIRLMRALKS